ncbi:MAG: RidA family protein [Alphaproteobacteria bacterium]|jgi:enamine deaminase RidA (YjgF/YER057c/UK114 family)|nr:RidA family protein [Alphaproteobacteria bacterium]MDP6623657.1 RidA family protein [Alphaproteobacteria bacterium]
MAGKIEARLVELGVVIPDAVPALANYVPWVQSGNNVWIAGQVPIVNGELTYVGKVGDVVELADAQAAARICGLNIISQVKAACDGDLDRVVRCLKVGGYVNAVADFGQHPQVINGASDLMVEVFGDAGRHARFAVGAGSLPRDVCVEIDAVFEVA